MVTNPDYYIGGTVGRGYTNPWDVLRLRRALNRTGHMVSPRNMSRVYDANLFDGVTGFQAEFGLKQDGVLEPGGPTDSAVAAALEADDLAGRQGVEMLRAPFAALSKAGFKYMSDPRNPASGAAWRDQRGERVPARRIQAALADAHQKRYLTEARRPRAIASIPSSTDPTEKLGGLIHRVFGGDPTTPWSADQTLTQAFPKGPEGAGRLRDGLAETAVPAKQPLENGATQSVSPSNPAPPCNTQSRPKKPHKPTDLERTLRILPPWLRTSWLDIIEADHRAMVFGGRAVGLDLAADFLEYYLDGKGGTYFVKPDRVRSYRPIRDAEKKNETRFEKNLLDTGQGGLAQKLLSVPDRERSDDREKVKIKDCFQAAFEERKIFFTSPDLALAGGNSRIVSDAVYKIRRKASIIYVDGTITHRWDDVYDFHPGKYAADEPLALETFGRAKRFKIDSSWRRRVFGTVEVKNGTLVNPRLTWTEMK